MPALESDIGAASRDALVVTWSSADNAARYPSARDGSVDAAEGYFDSAADAQAVVNLRGGLIGVERRRFTAVAQEPVWNDPTANVPRALLIDDEQVANANFIAARIEIDLDAETTSFELFG